jgi:DNA-binding transcriptional MocR family regulator
VIAGYTRRVRAAAAGPDQVIVSTGFAQGLSLVLRALAQAGARCVAFEDPGYGSARTDESVRAAVAAGSRVVHVPVDDLAMDVAALRASGAHVAVVTPAHQSPTGVVKPASRRLALLRGGETDQRSRPSTLDQLTLATLIESGRYDRHLRRMRAIYARRRDSLIAALRRHAPGVRLTGLAAGFHAVAHLPTARDERAVAAAARERLVGLHPCHRTRHRRHRRPA